MTARAGAGPAAWGGTVEPLAAGLTPMAAPGQLCSLGRAALGAWRGGWKLEVLRLP